MSLLDISTELKGNSYPGRGIIIGKSEDGENAVIAYFIMGRSENSLNRIFEETDKNTLRTRAFDESKLSDPSLVIYAPVRVLDNNTIVTNGDQTDTVYDFLKQGKTFEDALRTREFEPDPPIFTPRISGMVTLSQDSFSYKLSILKSNNGNGQSSLKFFFDYPDPISGGGHFIHTYKADGNPPQSFEGEPKPVTIIGNIDTFTQTLWNSLNSDRKISLYTRFININTGKSETRVMNKNK